MHGSSRWWVSMGCLGLLAAGGLAASLAFREPHGRVQRLPDGTVLEELGVTYGKTHDIALESWGQRTWAPFRERFLPWLPPDSRGWSAVRSAIFFGMTLPTVEGGRAHFETPQDEVVLWLRVRSSTAGSRSPILESSQITAFAIDEHGCRIPCYRDFLQGAGIRLANAVRWDGKEAIGVVEICNYPRRQRDFEVVLLERQSRAALASFRVTNRHVLSPREVPARTVRSAVTSHGVTFAVSSLERSGLFDLEGSSTLRYAAAQNGEAGPGWLLQSLTVGDGTGNQVTVNPQGTPGNAQIPSLCVREPYWVLTGQFTDFFSWGGTPDYVWRFHHLPVPRGQQQISIAAAALSHGLRLQLTGMLGPGPWKTHDWGASSRVRLQARMPATIPLTVRQVWDANGRSLLRPAQVCGGSEAGIGVTHELDLPELGAARWIDVELAAHRERNVEFVIRP